MGKVSDRKYVEPFNTNTVGKFGFLFLFSFPCSLFFVLFSLIFVLVQHNIARTVCGARTGTSHALITNELNWLTLADRRKGINLKNFARIVDFDEAQYLSDLLPARIGSVRPNSRNADNFIFY